MDSTPFAVLFCHWRKFTFYINQQQYIIIIKKGKTKELNGSNTTIKLGLDKPLLYVI